MIISLQKIIMSILSQSFQTIMSIMLTTNFYPQEIVQLIGTTPNEASITNLNPHLPSCVDMSKKKEEKTN
jgi:hypothetical protein